jgi:hypothetical protein
MLYHDSCAVAHSVNGITIREAAHCTTGTFSSSLPLLATAVATKQLQVLEQEQGDSHNLGASRSSLRSTFRQHDADQKLAASALLDAGRDAWTKNQVSCYNTLKAQSRHTMSIQ